MSFTLNDKIIYDQPLNELIRVCLRLEQLFKQTEHQLNDTSTLGSRNLIATIINILNLLDRPDLKAKLAKELNHHAANLSRYGNSPDIDSKKLNELMQKLDENARTLIDSSGKIGQRLRDIDLLNTLRLQLTNLGGGCSFDIPIYHHWLQQSAAIRQETIVNWLSDFNQIKTVIDLILELVRQNAKTEEKNAAHGFHQELLDHQANLRMIRIFLEQPADTYPEFSIGRHFLSVRFYLPNIEKRPQQYTGNVAFWIAYCNS